MAKVILYIWAGIIIGVSFIATPVKFLAPGLALQQALSVGQVTFNALFWVEGALLSLLFVHWAYIWAFNERIERRFGQCLILMSLIFCVQYFAILPILDERLLKIVSGKRVDPSHLHHVYVGVEILKLITVFASGYFIAATKNKESQNDLSV